MKEAGGAREAKNNEDIMLSLRKLYVTTVNQIHRNLNNVLMYLYSQNRNQFILISSTTGQSMKFKFGL